MVCGLAVRGTRSCGMWYTVLRYAVHGMRSCGMRSCGMRYAVSPVCGFCGTQCAVCGLAVRGLAVCGAQYEVLRYAVRGTWCRSPVTWLTIKILMRKCNYILLKVIAYQIEKLNLNSSEKNMCEIALVKFKATKCQLVKVMLKEKIITFYMTGSMTPHLTLHT